MLFMMARYTNRITKICRIPLGGCEEETMVCLLNYSTSSNSRSYSSATATSQIIRFREERKNKSFGWTKILILEAIMNPFKNTIKALVVLKLLKHFLHSTTIKATKSGNILSDREFLEQFCFNIYYKFKLVFMRLLSG